LRGPVADFEEGMEKAQDDRDVGKQDLPSPPRVNGLYGTLLLVDALQWSWLPRCAEMLLVTGTFNISQSEAMFNTGSCRRQNPLQTDTFLIEEDTKCKGIYNVCCS
jgi:hypothetical protein